MEPNQKTVLYALMAGLGSAFLYLLSVSGGFFSLLSAYLPLFPIFAIGLAIGPRAGSIVAASGVLFVGLLTSGFGGMVLYGLIYAIPASFFLHIALATIDQKRWYPIGGALTGLCLYGVFLIAILIPLTFQDGADFSQFFPPTEGEQPDWMVQAQTMLEKAPFMLFSFAVWGQILMFYGCAVLTNFLLKGWNYHIRPNLRLTPFMPSLFVLAVMLIAGIASFSETFAVQLAGKSAFVVLLLPYFLMGLARLHVRAQKWPNASLWLFAIYALTVLAFWPVFWFIGAGLYEQAKFLSNRASSGTEQ